MLAQDSSGISVLTVEPFVQVFRIQADGAEASQFSPDSQKVVFHTRSMHVEVWGVNGEMIEASEFGTTVDTCVQSALSPDGR